MELLLCHRVRRAVPLDCSHVVTDDAVGPKYQWTQPHMFLWVIVELRHGAKQERGLEGMSPSWLGWSRHTLQSGRQGLDRVLPAERPQARWLLREIKLPGGPMMEVLPQRGAGGSSAAAIAHDVPNGENP